MAGYRQDQARHRRALSLTRNKEVPWSAIARLNADLVQDITTSLHLFRQAVLVLADAGSDGSSLVG